MYDTWIVSRAGIQHYLFFSLCISVLAIGVFAFDRLLDTSAHTSNGVIKDGMLTLSTPLVAVLPPHGHEVGKDSMEDQGHHVGVTSPVVTAPEDMWVTGISYVIHGAPAFTLHHGTLFRLDARDLQCPTQSPQPLLSVSQDQAHTPTMQFDAGYGIFIPKGTPLILDAMFHNPGDPIGPGETYTDVSLQVDLQLAKPGDVPLTEVTYHLLRLSDAPCSVDSGHSFVVPPATEPYVFAGTSLESDASRLHISKPSRIVYWGAHLHGWEGGKTVTAKKNDTVLEVFTTELSRTVPFRYDTPHGNRDISLEEGDTLSIMAEYHPHSSSTIRGAMGHVGLYIAPLQ